jgi:hypothetical protein
MAMDVNPVVAQLRYSYGACHRFRHIAAQTTACGDDFPGMIRKSVKRFSEKIMRNNKLKRDGKAALAVDSRSPSTRNPR